MSKREPCEKLLDNVIVVAVDVGKNWGWCACGKEGYKKEDGDKKAYKDLNELIRFLRENSGSRVALGFEAPLFLPCWNEKEGLVPRKDFEVAKNAWYSNVAAGASTKAIPLMRKLFTDLKDYLKSKKITFSVEEFLEGEANFLFWEAWVSKTETLDKSLEGNSGGHGDLYYYLVLEPPKYNECLKDKHVSDAYSAVYAFYQYLFKFKREPQKLTGREKLKNKLDPEEIRKQWDGRCFNLVVSQLLWAGILELEDAQRLINCACPVVKARKLSEA